MNPNRIETAVPGMLGLNPHNAAGGAMRPNWGGAMPGFLGFCRAPK